MTIFQIKAHCPDMKAQVDLQQIREVLNDSPGFNMVDFSLETHSLVLTTANQDGGRDIIHKLSHAGFPPSDYEVLALPDHAERKDTSPSH